VLPGNAAFAAYRIRIETPTGNANAILNGPTVYWLQSDDAQEGKPGWLRLFGRCLSLDGSPIKAHIYPIKGPRRSLEIESTSANLWTAQFATPRLPPGQYSLQIDDRIGSEVQAGRFEVRALSLTKKLIFNVKEYGAVGDGRADDSEAVDRAIDAASAHGGEVFFPPGRFKLSHTVTLPPLVDLVGESQDKVVLFWPDSRSPPPVLIQGTSDFQIRNLTLYASNYVSFIANDTPSDSFHGNVRISNLVVRADPYRGHLTQQEVATRFREQQQHGPQAGDLIRLRGDHLYITNSDLYSGGRSIVLVGARDAVISGNRIGNGRWGWYSISGPDRVIFERNRVFGADLMSSGGGINTLDGLSSARNVYFGDNSFEDLYGSDREAVTTDGPGGYFYGRVRPLGKLRVQLGEALEISKPKAPWKGAAFFILGGTGIGEVARVMSYDAENQVVYLETPLQVLPDTSSIVTITPMQENFIFFRNSFIDTGVAIQYYGTSLNHVAAENTSRRTGGFFSSGRWYHNYQPSWYCQFFDNRIVEGGVYRGGSNNAIESGDAIIGAFGIQRAPNRAPLNIGAVLRRNRMDGGGSTEISGVSDESPGLTDAIVEAPQEFLKRVLIGRGVSRVLVRPSPTN
jgi:hypothetical protein